MADTYLIVRMTAAVECPTCRRAPDFHDFSRQYHGGAGVVKCQTCGCVEANTQWFRPVPAADQTLIQRVLP